MCLWLIHICIVSPSAGIMETQRRWVLGTWSPSLMTVCVHKTLTWPHGHILHSSNFSFKLLQLSLFSHIPWRAGHECPADGRRAEGAAVRPAGWGMGLSHTCRGVRTYHQSHRPALHPGYDAVKLIEKVTSSVLHQSPWGRRSRVKRHERLTCWARGASLNSLEVM